MIDLTDTRRAVWTRHWATGAAHSCAGSFGDTYGGGIAAAWRAWHAVTPVGARVLDIASGSGALPRLLAQLRPDHACSIDAIDLADTVPDWLCTRPAATPMAVRFHAGVAAELLPFPDAAFDAVISQYGLEYADLDAAVLELLRVLAPRGRIALVLHHADSRPVKLARVEMAHIEWLRSPQGLLATARALLGPMALASTPAGRAGLAGDRDAAERRGRFNQLQRDLEDRLIERDGADILHEVRSSVHRILNLARGQGYAAADAAWSLLDATLAESYWRLGDLRRAALTPKRVEHLQGLLSRRFNRTALDIINDGPHNMGWILTAEA